VVPAVRQYVALRGLPPTPDTGMDAQAYYRFAAGGWMDSKIREGPLVRHAVWPGFGPQAAVDAACGCGGWRHTNDPALGRRLAETAATVASAVPPERLDAAAVSHVRDPVQSLVLGHVLENARRAEAQARAMLGSRWNRTDPSPSNRPNRQDFARTNPAPVANGLTATHVVKLLEAAAVSGDRELIDAALRMLRGMDRYEHDVPRGAQSWEVPLHTPDVLASAWLVRAYVAGYELTGEKRLLELAEYWAWTGVPFVYLHNPTGGGVGPYATIAVYGATNWVEPVWFGRPVQWCGLVYADALYRLAEHEQSGPWKRMADGITACGIQQSWPASDRERQALLPDFYHLRAQSPDGPAINPGTLQANAIRLFGGPRHYDLHRFRGTGWVVHAPGEIEPIAETKEGLRFRVRGWPLERYHVLVSGLGRVPSVRINGAEAAGDAIVVDEPEGRVVIRVSGDVQVVVGEMP
jgi:hypothetical protein